MSVVRIPNLFILGAVAVLASCATSTPYQPAGETGEYGFSEQKIEDNRFRISFRGNSLTTREQVETFLLYRAAQVTLEQGYDHFIVVKDDTERETTLSGSAPAFAYYGRGRPFPYYGFGYRFDPFYNDFDVRERNRYTAIAYIVLGRGKKPENETTAYDARQVIENLGPVVEGTGS